MDRLSVGVDLGQASDPTAIAVCDPTGGIKQIRHLERIALGTPYPKVCERIATLCAALPGSRLIVDGTGVGRAVVDLLEGMGLSPLVVTLTSGEKARREGSRFWVPKARLLRPLIRGIESGGVQIAFGLGDAPALVRELQAFMMTRSKRGYIKYAGKGAHDDLVIASALALFLANGEWEWMTTKAAR